MWQISHFFKRVKRCRLKASCRVFSNVQFFWFALLTFIPQWVWAAAGDWDEETAHDIMNGSGKWGSIHTFIPPLTDKSIQYLQEIFGTVDGVLHGTSGQLMGHLFGVFNSAVLAVAGFTVAYMAVTSTVNWAHDGEFMGRGKNAAWIAFRTVGGIGILVPKATGYSMVQVFVMWAVVQGVGLADTAWVRTLDYLQNEGGAIVIAPETGSDSGMIKSLSSVQEIFKSSVCVAALNNIEQRQQTDNNNRLKQNPLDPTLRSRAQDTDSYGTTWDESNKVVSFGNKSGKGDDVKLCGQYSWAQAGTKDDTKMEIYERYKRAGLQQVVLDLSPAADYVVHPSLAPLISSDNVSSADEAVDENRSVQAILGATEDFENIMQPALRGAREDVQADLKGTLGKAGESGWISAGSYYRDIGNINNLAANKLNNYQVALLKGAPTTNGDGAGSVASLGLGKYGDWLSDALNQAAVYNKKASDTMGELPGVGEGNVLSSSKIGGLEGEVAATTAAMTAASSPTMPSGIPVILATLGATTIGVVVAWDQTINGLAESEGGIMGSTNYSSGVMKDPIAAVQQFGNVLVGLFVGLWLAATVAAMVSGGVSFLCSAQNPLPFAAQNALSFFAPVVFAFMTTLLVAGLVLSVYVPLIPFLLFTFASIGWLIAVLEAMAAAPLVALGITHPEGHDLLGKAEQALMLLLSVFLRPICMIIGFLAGMILVRVTMRLLNAGFSHVIDATNITTSGANMFAVLALIVVYTMTVVGIIKMSFDLIHIIPEKVMRWIGGHPEQSGYDSLMETVKGGVQSAGKGPSDLLGGAGKGMSDMAVRQAYDVKGRLPPGVRSGGSAGPGQQPAGGAGSTGTGGQQSGSGTGTGTGTGGSSP